MNPEAALTYALIACVGVFLPGFLLVLAFSSSWQELSLKPRLQAAVAGVNAVAVGMLAAAWWNPVLSSAPHDWLAILTAVLGLLVLRSQRVPTALIVLAFAGFGVLVYA
jgi:chromate transporter